MSHSQSDIQAAIPSSPVVWTDTGLPRIEWLAFFRRLWARTGGAEGTYAGVGTITGVTTGTGLTGGGTAGNVSVALSVPVTIPNGGTGGTTAAQALTNLGAMPLQGVTNGSNAAPGSIGEYLTAQLAQGSAIGLTSNTAANVISLSLTAGDWDVWGTVDFGGTATSFTSAQGWVGTVSAAAPAAPALGWAMMTAGGSSVFNPTGIVLAVNSLRINVTATTTVYLGALAIFSGGTGTAFGIIAARRRR